MRLTTRYACPTRRGQTHSPVLLAFAVLLVLLVRAAAAAPELVIGPGDAEDGWFALPAGAFGWTLYHVPAEASAGTVRRVGLMAERPNLWAASRGRLVMAFAPRPPEVGANTGSQAKAPASPAPPVGWRLREVTVSRRMEQYLYSSPAPLPPVERTFVPVELALAGDDLYTLGLASGAATLRVLDGGVSWREVPLPADSSSSPEDWRVLSIARRPLLLERRSEGARAWTKLPGGTQPAAAAWSARPIGAFEDVIVIADTLHQVRRNAQGAWDVGLVRGDRVLRTCMLPPLDTSDAGNTISDGWLVPAGDRLGWYWASTTPSDTASERGEHRGSSAIATRLFARVASPRGTVVHDGPAELAGPIAQREFEALGLALLSVVVAVGAFVFRREGAGGDAVVLPVGASLAWPGRRMLAGLLDAALAFAVAGWVWDIGVPQVIVSGFGQGSSGHGVRPFATGLVFLFVYGAVAEALSGRTLGKGMLGCRVASASTGRRPTWTQAIGRNAVKAFCPPLAVLDLIPGVQTRSGLFRTVVLDERRDRSPPD